MKVLKFFRGLLIRLAILIGLALIGIVFKVQIATALGNYLVYEDADKEVEAAFVLSGLPNERLPFAYSLYQKGLFDELVATGERKDPDLEILQMPWSDAFVAKKVLIRLGTDSVMTTALEKGSNTFEESEAILQHCKAEGYKEVMVISSKFHTRRIKQVFKNKFEESGIRVYIKGAPPLDYSMDEWWISNIAVSFAMNEYAKILYYKFTY